MTIGASNLRSRPVLSRPPFWRVLLAFVVAPLVASVFPLVISLLWSSGWERENWRSIVQVLPYVVAIGGYLPTVVFGVPAYIFLSATVRPTLINCALVGAAVAALPWLLLGALAGPDYAFSNGHVTHQNGMRTLDGWVDLLLLSGSIGLLGAVGGVVFWTVAALGMRPGPTVASGTRPPS